MPSEPRWLTPAEVIEINRIAVAETGEPHMLVQPAMLDGALGRPRNRYAYSRETDLGRLAAFMLVGISKNHAFQQGNKRTALIAADVFLTINGHEFVFADEALADPVLDVTSGALDEMRFVAHFAAGVRKIGAGGAVPKVLAETVSRGSA